MATPQQKSVTIYLDISTQYRCVTDTDGHFVAYPIWAYDAHGRQRRCQEDPVSLSSGGLEKTTRSSPHHMAQHCPTGSETTPPYAARCSRFGSEPPSVEDDVNIWRYAILRVTCQKRRRRQLSCGRLTVPFKKELLYVLAHKSKYFGHFLPSKSRHRLICGSVRSLTDRRTGSNRVRNLLTVASR